MTLVTSFIELLQPLAIAMSTPSFQRVHLALCARGGGVLTKGG